MKVIHIIPSAFNYFSDIRARVFTLIEELQKFDLVCDAITVQYGTAIKKDVQEEIQEVAPSRDKSRLVNVPGTLASLADYDVVHIHCPILGELQDIIRWKREHPDTTMVVTYYRSIPRSDLFSWVVIWYNAYYLPKLFGLADVVTYPEFRKEAGRYEKRTRPEIPKLVVDETKHFLDMDLTADAHTVQLNGPERQAWKYAFIYNQLVGLVTQVIY